VEVEGTLLKSGEIVVACGQPGQQHPPGLDPARTGHARSAHLFTLRHRPNRLVGPPERFRSAQ
jgi:hypothetical protein